MKHRCKLFQMELVDTGALLFQTISFQSILLFQSMLFSKAR